jgi:hypothetical protein
MKTYPTLFTIMLLLQSSLLFATGTDTRSRTGNLSILNISLKDLAPVIPATATFEDLPEPAAMSLAPVTPAEATFTDTGEHEVVTGKMAPFIPDEACFDDDCRFQSPEQDFSLPSGKDAARFAGK